MKPECHRVVEQLAALSADDLSPAEAEIVRRHLEECPPCHGHWVLFERTLLTLSRTADPKLTARQSSQMWLVCLEHAKAAQSGNQDRTAKPGSTWAGSEPNSILATLTKNFGWLTATPRVGWAVAGGAAAILGLTYFLAPQPESGDSSVTQVAFAPLPNADFGEFRDFTRGSVFQAPPANASALVDYHTAMSFEPYSDHVGPSLIAYSASAPREFVVPNFRRTATQP